MGLLKKLFGGNSENKRVVPSVAEDLEETKSETNPVTGEETEDEEELHERKYKFETLRDDGLRALQVNQVDYAVRCLSSALEYKDDDTTRLHLAEAYMRLYKGGEALPLLDTLISHDGDNGHLYVTAANAAEQIQDWNRMDAYARKAVEKLQEDDEALYALARSKYNMEDYPAAEEYLTTLIGRNEEYAVVRQLRARTFYEQKKYAEAEADLDSLVEKGKATEDTYLLKGLVAQERSDYHTAEEAFQKIIEMNPFSTEGPLHLAQLEMEKGCPEKALEYLDEAISMQDDFHEAYMLRAKVKRMLHDEAGAAEDEETASRLKPKEADGGEEENIENKMNDYYKKLNPYGF